jgi:hypothetical protein
LWLVQLVVSICKGEPQFALANAISSSGGALALSVNAETNRASARQGER